MYKDTFDVLDFKKYFQLLHLLSIINSLMVPDITICFLMHGNVNIVTKGKKVKFNILYQVIVIKF